MKRSTYLSKIGVRVGNGNIVISDGRSKSIKNWLGGFERCIAFLDGKQVQYHRYLELAWMVY